MVTWIGGPMLDPLGEAFGQGLGKYIAKREITSDTDALLNWIKQREQAQQYGGMAAGMTVGGPLGGMMGSTIQPDMSSSIADPKLKSAPMQGLLLQLKLGQMMSPLQQAQIRNENAQSMLYEEQAKGIGNKPPTQDSLKAAEMQWLDSSLAAMKAEGKEDTPLYKSYQRRRDIMYGVENVSSPSQEIAKKRLEVLSGLDPKSREYRQALGITTDKPVPEKLSGALQEALDAIGQGADPVKVYREFFKSDPDLQEYSSTVRRILLAGEDPFADFLRNIAP